MTANGAGVSAVPGVMSLATAHELAKRGETAMGGVDNVNSEYRDGMATHKMAGTVIPSHMGAEGASAGFDSNQRRPIHVDPDVAGASFIIQPMQPGEVSGDAAPSVPVRASGYDKNVGLRQTAADAMRAMSAESPPTSEERVEAPVPYPPQVNQYVAPPTPAPVPAAAGQQAPPVQLREAPQVPQPILPASAPEQASAALRQPTARIVFDMGGEVGEFDCYYHRIFRDGMCLVLVWALGFQGSRYSPPAGIKRPIRVTVGGERDKYTVFVGPRFHDEHYNEEFLVLLIDEGEK